ncbi:site-specific integrase [Phyllobacterium sp. UNC302MFCol5.2]|uniref:tyrosine-type recombinase/integrase n=1 Tax=Phyllobacterium sp. UNC302MFCol5.2 TaxID=1449065 RepID=UPI00048614FD|nr:site-specific integrase [Phyllobacterium sp. UNC302MFCol5.2]
MARQLHKLTDVEVKTAGSGRLGDGGGLWLEVASTGSRAWLFLFKLNGRRSAMGLGGYPNVSLAQARRLANSARDVLSRGGNPLTESRREAVPTFAECVDRFLDDQRMALWRNEKHRRQWSMTLSDSYCKHLRPMQVSEIAVADILKVLKPIWLAKPETASRLRGRIERLLAFAEAQGWRSEGKNPAVWRGGLDAILPKPGKLIRGHHAAMPYRDVPAFVSRLRGAEAMAARALEFLVLTAGRSGEVLNAKWDEVDLKHAIWTVPASRMKAGRKHEVPLSPRAVAILNGLSETRRNDFVFPGERKDRPLSASTLEMLLRRMKIKPFTPHGFRSSFRDWTGDETSFPRELAEAALAHAVGDATERAYRRSSALEKRKKLMIAWASYIDGPAKDQVIELRPR